MKILSFLPTVMRKQLIVPALALGSGLFSSCATSSYQNYPSETYTEGQVSDWKAFLATSPLSNDVSPRSSTVRSKVKSYLPERFNTHIRAVADHIDRTAAAERLFSVEATRINREYEINKSLAPVAPLVYDSLRDKQSEGFWGYLFHEIMSRNMDDLAVGFSKSRYESQMREASSRIFSPVLESGKELVIEEYELTRRMRVQPSRNLSRRVQAISDEHLRGLIQGVWKENPFFPKLWVFSSNGSYEWEHPFSNSSESGNWSINNGILRLKSRFGTTDYRINQSGKSLILENLNSRRKSTLGATSSNPGDYRGLLRQIKNPGGGYRYGGSNSGSGIRFSL